MLHTMPPIAMLWDDAHIWGLMSLRALWSLGFPVWLVKGKDIAQGALFRKQSGREPSRVLVVPGGSAGLKAEALGEAGKTAVQDFVRQGGRYLGFCGGAGLALSHGRGLGLCPWIRADYPQRFLHLISGWVLADPCPHELTPSWGGRTPSLPVWWPGRFGNSGGDVEVIARYRSPDRDFWIADIALESVPQRIQEEWKELYGLDFTANFLTDSELIVHGRLGEGDYVLSYAHLETPDSPDANAWFAHLMGRLSGADCVRRRVPPWPLLAPAEPGADAPGSLGDLAARTRELIALAMDHRLFFARTPWLMGWKSGLPGGMCNNLLAALAVACTLRPVERALAFWRESEKEALDLADQFFDRAEGYLLAARLADTFLPSLPDVIDKTKLNAERSRLFGHPMLGRGLLGRLLALVEEYIFLCLEDR